VTNDRVCASSRPFEICPELDSHIIFHITEDGATWKTYHLSVAPISISPCLHVSRCQHVAPVSVSLVQRGFLNPRLQTAIFWDDPTLGGINYY